MKDLAADEARATKDEAANGDEVAEDDKMIEAR